MRPIRLHPPFDHGAVRVPPPSDKAGWRTLWRWLGEAACAVAESASVQVRTPDGPVIARCGDWIVLSHSGSFHVAHAARACDA
jgi:hypothetical protein